MNRFEYAIAAHRAKQEQNRRDVKALVLVVFVGVVLVYFSGHVLV